MMLEIIAIILSLTALIVTVMGFFASLRFYRDGMDLQTRASDALARIEEKTALIHKQFGGVLDRTLDAIFGQLPGGATGEQPLPSRAPAGDGVAVERAEPDGGQTSNMALRYYALRGYKLSNVATGVAQGLYSLGAPYGFNLLDGQEGIIYVGFFPDLVQREVAARAILLLQALAPIAEVVETSTEEVREEGRRILAQLRVELIVADEVDRRAVLTPIGPVRERVRDAPPVEVLHVGELDERIDDRLGELGV